VGVPAKQIGWMSEYGDQIPLPLIGEGKYQCPHTQNIYQLNKNILVNKPS
jgi:UDP-2-acetamido-3-amino-2,3-dideoxy-glucuronate N-acetyltransferase